MEDQKSYPCRVDEHLSPANRIPNPRQIIQAEVCQAKFTLQDEQRRGMSMAPDPGYWDRTSKAYETMHRAYKHQPGERGSMTIGKGDIVSGC